MDALQGEIVQTQQHLGNVSLLVRASFDCLLALLVPEDGWGWVLTRGPTHMAFWWPIQIQSRTLKTDIWGRYLFAVTMKIFVLTFQTNSDGMNQSTIYSSTLHQYNFRYFTWVFWARADNQLPLALHWPIYIATTQYRFTLDQSVLNIERKSNTTLPLHQVSASQDNTLINTLICNTKPGPGHEVPSKTSVSIFHQFL